MKRLVSVAMVAAVPLTAAVAAAEKTAGTFFLTILALALVAAWDVTR